jgi:hypothetical protein
VVAVIGLWRSRHDPRLSSEATARALRARLHTPYGFHCVRQENDGTIDLSDVDYLCEPERPQDVGYWVGTDSRKITGIQPTG